MKKRIPKYNFNKTLNIEFEITTINSIYQKSKSKFTKPHRQNFFGLFYFTNSYGKHIVDFKEYAIKEGDVFLISNEQVHYFQNIEKTNGKIILFTNAFLGNDFLIEQIFEQNISNPILSLNTELLVNLNALISQIEYVFASNKKFKTVILRKYLEILLFELNQIQQDNPLMNDINYQRFIQFKKDLKKNYKKQKSVKYYAAKQFISTKTLNIAIRKTIDKSAKQFINEYIVLLAKRMLINTNSTSAEIAYELGFLEPTNFAKFFKNIEGISPALFQKEQKNS